MNRTASRRRGIMLPMLVMVIAVVAALLSILAASSGQYLRQQRADQARNVARAMATSAAAYAHRHWSEWAADPPAEAIELDVRSLLPGGMSGQATIRFASIDNRRICRISTAAQIGALGAADQMDLDLASQ